MGPRRSIPFSSVDSERHVSSSLISRLAALLDEDIWLVWRGRRRMGRWLVCAQRKGPGFELEFDMFLRPRL